MPLALSPNLIDRPSRNHPDDPAILCSDDCSVLGSLLEFRRFSGRTFRMQIALHCPARNDATLRSYVQPFSGRMIRLVGV